MLFYKFTANLGEPLTQGVSREERRELASGLMGKTNEFNQRAADKTICFISHLGKKALIGGLCAEGPVTVSALVERFFAALELPYTSYHVEETTLTDFRQLVRQGDAEDLLDNFEDRFRPYNAHIDSFRSLDYEELLIPEKADRAALEAKAEELLWKTAVTEELERIYQGTKNPKVYAHPVHYLLETGTESDSETIPEVLLSALYANGRLWGRRYGSVWIEADGNGTFDSDDFQKFCDNSRGCAVVVLLNLDCSEEGAFSAPSVGLLESVGEIICKMKSQVQFVICIPGKAAGLREKLFDVLTGVTLVELREDVAFGDTAKAYLKRQARKCGMTPTKALLQAVPDPGKGFHASDLDAIFEAWYTKQLKTVVYPQYAQIATTEAKKVKEKAKGSAYQELQEMIGLAEAKAVMDKALNFYKMRKVYQAHGVKGSSPAMHMVFTGAPGTAKTTVARLFAQIMKDNGVLSQGGLVEVGRADLVGKYVGHTAPLVKQKFRKAAGGVLFIDEAYSLVDDRDGMFGDEAINTIVQEMENHREDLVVIFAGYPDKMESFLNKNPGLRSRIGFHVPFDDYSADELVDITRLMAKNTGLKLSPDVKSALVPLFQKAKLCEDYGNGRFVRNLLEQARMNQAARLASGDLDALTTEEIVTLLPEDFRELTTVAPRASQARRVIGFSA